MGGDTREHSFCLHLGLGPAFILGATEKYGVQAFNRWNDALALLVPGFWKDTDSEPALCFWFSLDGADLSGTQWNQIFLGLASCRGTRFDHSSLVAAEIGYCPGASFRSCDMRRASLCGDLSSVDFTDAITEGIRLEACTYHEGRPPVGLPAGLLLQCLPVPAGEPGGTGGTEYPVEVTASLMRAWEPK